MLMPNRRKMTQNCWIFGATRGSDEEAGKSDEEAGKNDEEAEGDRKRQRVKERKRRKE